MTATSDFKQTAQEAVQGLEWQIEHLGPKNQERAIKALATILTMQSIIRELYERKQMAAEILLSPLVLDTSPDSVDEGPDGTTTQSEAAEPESGSTHRSPGVDLDDIQHTIDELT